MVEKLIAAEKPLEKMGALDEATLLAHATTWRRDAQHSVERFAAWLRYAVLGCLVAQALMITVCVYHLVGTASAWMR